MANPAALYSYKGQEPGQLPHEISWVEEWGQITYRTDVSSFTDEELAKAGYTGPYEIPSFDQEYQTRRWDRENLTYVVEDISDEELWSRIRAERNRKLSECDWTMVSDVPVEVNQREWEMYRQRLRDLPAQFDSPKDVVWPRSPEGRSDNDFDQPRVFNDKLRWRVGDLEGEVKILKKELYNLIGIASTGV